MELENLDFETADSLDMAFACSALFDQYDESSISEVYDECENLYPSLG